MATTSISAATLLATIVCASLSSTLDAYLTAARRPRITGSNCISQQWHQPPPHINHAAASRPSPQDPPHRQAATAATTTTTELRMFTGIVEEMGEVVSLESRDDMPLWDGSLSEGVELTVKASTVLEGAYLGCSICVSGACLTATHLDFDQSTFRVGLAPETLRKTNLGELQKGSLVNLERASEMGGRNSGHFVQGHVDGTGTIVNKYPDQDSLVIVVQVPPELLRYLVPKGFVAVDGTSLTVVDVNPVDATFSFMLVSYTQSKIVVPRKSIGDTVNIEVDVLGKYSEAALNLQVLPRFEALEAHVSALQQELDRLKASVSAGAS